MPRSSLFSPFSKKYLLKKAYLRDGRGAPRLLIDTGLTWHWGVRHDEMYVDIQKNFEELKTAEFEFYSTDSDCIVEHQPMWGMEQSWDERDRTAPDRPDEGRDADTDTSKQCAKWRMEHLAYYSPAHTNSPGRYGIHLSKGGVAKLADQIHQICPQEPLEIIQLASAYKLFAHEMCHAWIEDICCLIDFSAGETASKLSRRYAKVHRKYNGYIFMEEAICNTAAYGWLHHFLFDATNKDDRKGIPPFDPQNVLNAFGQWMRRQPKGYRDFLAIDKPPHLSEQFVRNVCRLLVEVYGANEKHWHETAEVVGVFFDGHIDPDFRHFHPRDSNRWDTLWVGEPPVHVES